jgi:hypothetical protein
MDSVECEEPNSGSEPKGDQSGKDGSADERQGPARKMFGAEKKHFGTECSEEEAANHGVGKDARVITLVSESVKAVGGNWDGGEESQASGPTV